VTDPLRAERDARRAAKGREPAPAEELPQPSAPLVSQGARSQPPLRPEPSPDDYIRAAADHARAKPHGWVRI
jgi:hypothetical protein